MEVVAQPESVADAERLDEDDVADDSHAQAWRIMTEKLSASLPTVASAAQIMGGYVQVGAKLGGEIGGEIAKEHPDWVKQPATSSGSQ